MEVRIATEKELEDWWDEEIRNNPNDNSYVVWKNGFVKGNKDGERKTFFAFEHGKYIGQGTIRLRSEDENMTGNGRAEIVKLEVVPKWRGKGVSTKIYNAIKDYAKQNCIDTLTIGVEPCEIKNMQIYFHWGFTNFIKVITEEFPPKIAGEKGEVITVLCYMHQIDSVGIRQRGKTFKKEQP